MTGANFASDNVTGASPEIVEALARAASEGPARPYGNDAWTAAVEAKLRDIFETELIAFPVLTGSAANALALGAITPPYGAVFCHPESHINTDECGAPEFFTGGAKLIAVTGPDAKIDPGALQAAITRTGALGIHSVKPSAVSITQASEAGTVYRPDELRAIADIAKRNQLKLHMDGARFANAVAHLGCHPGDVTWRAGIDVLSFGATKNGAMAAEMVIFFNANAENSADIATDFAHRRKRGGHLLSKQRFVSAQLVAYLDNDLWLRNAAHANAMTQRLATGLAALGGADLLRPVDANEIFVGLPDGITAALKADGFVFYDHQDFGTANPFARLVCNFATTETEIDAFLAAAKRHLAKA